MGRSAHGHQALGKGQCKLFCPPAYWVGCYLWIVPHVIMALASDLTTRAEWSQWLLV